MAGHLAVFPSIGFEQERESMKGFMGGADPKRWHLLVGAFHLAWSAISLTGVVWPIVLLSTTRCFLISLWSDPRSPPWSFVLRRWSAVLCASDATIVVVVLLMLVLQVDEAKSNNQIPLLGWYALCLNRRSKQRAGEDYLVETLWQRIFMRIWDKIDVSFMWILKDWQLIVDPDRAAVFSWTVTLRWTTFSGKKFNRHEQSVHANFESDGATHETRRQGRIAMLHHFTTRDSRCVLN